MERMVYITLLRAIVFLTSLFVIEFYFAKRINKSLVVNNYFKDERKLSRLIFFVIAFFNLFPIFSSLAGVYGVLNPATEFEIPKNFVLDYIFRIPSYYFIVIIVQVVLLFGPIDFIFFVIKNLKKQLSPRLESLLLKFLIYLSMFFVAYIPLRSYNEFKSVAVEKRIYNLKTNKKDLNNFRIAFFSDIQMDRFTDEKRVKHFIDELNKLNADIVLAGGDFITGDSNYIPIVASLVKNINSKYGTFSAIGDHDFFGYKKQYWRSIEEVKKALKANDVNMVDDGNVFFFINESSIKITFLSNTYVKSYNEKTFDSLAQNNSNFDLKILVSHQPDEKIAIKAKDFGYNLYLSGHTHGGQVNFIFPFIKLTPVILETKFISGDFWFDDLLMIVNRGLGMSNMPIRFNSMPEISLIEIQTAQN